MYKFQLGLYYITSEKESTNLIQSRDPRLLEENEIVASSRDGAASAWETVRAFSAFYLAAKGEDDATLVVASCRDEFSGERVW